MLKNRHAAMPHIQLTEKEWLKSNEKQVREYPQQQTEFHIITGAVPQPPDSMSQTSIYNMRFFR